MPLPLVSLPGSRDGRGAGTRAETAARRQRTQLKASRVSAPPTSTTAPHNIAPVLESSRRLRRPPTGSREARYASGRWAERHHSPQDTHRTDHQDTLPFQRCATKGTTCLPHLVQGLVYITETAEQGSNTPSPSRKHGDSTRDPDLTLAISNERCRLERTVAERTGAVTCRTQRARAQDSGSTNAPVAPALLRAARGGGFSFTPFSTRFHGQRPGSGRGLAPGSGGEPWGAFGPPY